MSRKTTSLLAAPTLAGVLVLSGCGMGSPDEVVSPDATSGEEETHSSQSDAQDNQDNQDTDNDTTDQGEVGPETAAEIALEAHPESRVYEIELERSHGLTVWEINLVTDQARYELEVDVTTGEVVSDREKSTDDLGKYISRLDDAKITYTEALEMMDEAHPGAKLVEMELDHEDGELVWEFELVTSDDVEYDLVIHAATGEVLENEQD